MALTAAQLFAHGAFEAQYARRSSDGYPMGVLADPDNAVGNTTTHARRLRGFVEATEMQMTIAEVEEFGGMKPLAKKQVGVEAVSGFTLTLSSHDEVLKPLVTGGSLDTTTYSTSAIYAPNSNKGDLPQGMLALSTKLQDESGTPWWYHILYHNIVMRPLNFAINSGTGRNPMASVYQVTASQAKRTMLGVLFADLALDIEDESDYYIVLRTANRIGFTTYVHNGSATTFTTGYLPLDDDATGEGANRYSKNGAIAALTSVAPSTGVATLTAAGTSLDKSVLVYDTAFRAA